jgi:hypothetical protein
LKPTLKRERERERERREEKRKLVAVSDIYLKGGVQELSLGYEGPQALPTRPSGKGGLGRR